MQNPSPKDLVDRCLAHDEAAWAELVRRYANLIYSTILRVQLPDEEIEEAFQSSVIAIHQQLPALREPERLVSWIIGIAHRQAINRIRARTRGLTYADVEVDTHMTEDALPEEERLRLTEIQSVQEAFSQLPERCRRLLQWLFFEDPAPDYETISRRERLPVGSIGPTRARCLEKLRMVLVDRGWEP